MNDTNLLIRVLRPAPRRILGIMPARPKPPELNSDEEAFAVTFSSTDGREISRLSATDLGSALKANREAAVLAIRKSPQPLSAAFSDLKKDHEGHGWDLSLIGTYAVTDARTLLERFGLDSLSPESGLSGAIAESWLINALRPKILDAVRDYSLPDIREKDALPVRWWETQLNQWLTDAGVAFNLSEARWQSADAARAEAERARIADMESIERENERKLQAELRETQAQAQYEVEKAKIEADRCLSDADRSHQLQVLELRHRKELLDAETEIENARRAAEQAALEHEVTLARLHQDRETILNAEARLTEKEQQNAALAETLSKTQEALDKLSRISEPLLQRLADGDTATANTAAERLVSPEFGFDPAQLRMLGFTMVNQTLVDNLTQKQKADRQSVQLSKPDLTTRDIGAAKVKALPIGRSLQFKIESKRAGCLTLLNLGTSGAVYVHVPNGMLPTNHVSITADREYYVPGPELFPWQWDYREEGPAGWEHIVGIVTDNPLLPDDLTARSTPDAPIVRLTPEEVENIFTTLRTMEDHAWSAGVLSFLVG